ncbi:retrotransposon protein, putative, ty1-copia subclass, partial [Tanacetum coccineum]
CVKEKQSLIADKEKSGVEPSANKDGVTPSITVASRDTSSSREENSVKAGHDNLHDVNAEETPSVEFSHFIYTRGNGVDVVVPMESMRAISKRFANTAYGFFLGKRVAYPVVANYVRNTWGNYGLVKSMLNSSTGIFSFQFSSMEGLDAMLENEDVGNVPVWVKLYGVPVTAFSEDGLSAIATKLGTPLMLDSYTSDMGSIRVMFVLSMNKNLPDVHVVRFLGHVLDECPKNKDSNVVKNIKKPGQTHRGVSVGPKMGFQPAKQVYRQVSKKNNVSTSGRKKKDVEPTIKVSKSNSFDVLNSVKNDVDLGINGGRGLQVWLVKRPILLDPRSGMWILVVLGDHDSKDEVASVDNDMANFLASKDVGYGINSLLEQWKESYGNEDYDYDPYDDDMYEGHDIPDKIQDICDNLDIKVRGRKKK